MLLKIQLFKCMLHTVFFLMGCIENITWKFCTSCDCVSKCWRGVGGREQSSGAAPVHACPWRIMARTGASVAFHAYNGIRHQFTFPTSFLTSPFSYLVSFA